jgi:hypothetical protein
MLWLKMKGMYFKSIFKEILFAESFRIIN